MQYSAVDRLLIYAVDFIERGELLAANRVIYRALSYAPLNADTWYIKAFTHSLWVEQEHALRQALTHDPHHRLARQKYAQLTNQGRAGEKLTREDFEAPQFYARIKHLNRALLRDLEGYLAFLDRSDRRKRLNNLQVPVLMAVLIVATVLYLVVWFDNATPNDILQLASIQTEVPTRIPTLTNTPGPSPTPRPTRTPQPTRTPRPTQTPIPTYSPELSAISPLYLNITDAEYSNSLDRIIALTDNPAQLHIIDPHTHNYDSIDLPLSGWSMSVHPDGGFVAIGHSESITYIDLREREIINNFGVTGEALHIILRQDNTVIYYRWNGALTVRDANTGALIVSAESPLFRDIRSLIRHPDGQSVFSYQNEVSYVNVGNNTITLESYEEITLPRYDLKNVWFSASGDRVYTERGLAYNVILGDDDNLAYDVSVPGTDSLTYLNALVHDPISNRLIGIIESRVSSGQQHIMYVWQEDSLEIQETAPLPSSWVNGRLYSPTPQWLFINSTSTEFYMLSSTPPDDRDQTITNEQIVQGFGTGIMTGSLTQDRLLDQFMGYALTWEIDNAQYLNPDIQTNTAYQFANSVVDADYSASLDKLIFVSSQPYQLHILDPETLDETIVPLSRLPQNVSLTTDGLSAIVAQDGMITHVNLETATIINTYDIPERAIEAVLSDGGWLYYAYVVRGQSQAIGAININTGQSFLDVYSSFEATNILHLQPNTGLVYLFAGYYPHNEDEIDLQMIHARGGDCSPFWLIANGDYFIDGCGTIVGIGSSPSGIISEIGSTPYRSIFSIADIPQRDELLIVERSIEDRDDRIVPIINVVYWDIENFTPLGNRNLFTEFEIDDEFVNDIGGRLYSSHIFVDSSGQHFYAILQAYYDSIRINSTLRFDEYYLIRGEISETLDIIPYPQD